MSIDVAKDGIPFTTVARGSFSKCGCLVETHKCWVSKFSIVSGNISCRSVDRPFHVLKAS